MNELFVFLATVRDAGGIYLLLVLAVAAGFLLFDRRQAKTKAQEAAPSHERMAA